MDTFWLKQEYSKPLFEDLLWSRPEQKSQAGKLLIVGGNMYAIAAPSEAFVIAKNQGIGEVKVIMPDKTRKMLGPKMPPDIELVASTPSGSFSTKAELPLRSYIAWADATLFAGDIGRNSETAILLETAASKISGLQIYTRDAADYFNASIQTIIDRPETLLVISLSQLQKFCQSLNWPTAITFDMGVGQLCTVLSELTSVHKCSFAIQYFSSIVVAVNGEVIVTKLLREPKTWRLKTATAASVWWLQNQTQPLKAIATAITQLNW